MNEQEIQKDFEIINAATKGPWTETCGVLKHYVSAPNDEFCFSFQEMHPMDGHETNAHNDCVFVAASREGWERALNEVVRMTNNAIKLLKWVEDVAEELETLEKNGDKICATVGVSSSFLVGVCSSLRDTLEDH